MNGSVCTLARIATVIERLTGVRHHPAHVWALLHHRLGCSVQRPLRRAAERNQAAIDRWVAEDWPRIKQTPIGAEPVWCSSTSPRSASLIEVLCELRRFLGGKKATLLWLPAYAPELNPVEGLWSSLTGRPWSWPPHLADPG